MLIDTSVNVEICDVHQLNLDNEKYDILPLTKSRRLIKDIFIAYEVQFCPVLPYS